MNEKLILEALEYGLECARVDGSPAEEPFLQALASIDAEKVEYCEWTQKYEGYNSPPERPSTYFSYPFAFCPYCGKPIRIKETTSTK